MSGRKFMDRSRTRRALGGDPLRPVLKQGPDAFYTTGPGSARWGELAWHMRMYEAGVGAPIHIKYELQMYSPALPVLGLEPQSPREVTSLSESMSELAEESFEVFVMKEDFKFHCAHFVTFSGFRERLHGHNYTVGVRMRGIKRGPDGYLIDFGDIKKATRALCKELNERFICPMDSSAMTITVGETQVELRCEDGAYFSFPKGDCALLPIEYSTTEELAAYFWFRLLQSFNAERLLQRGIRSLEIVVAEAPRQEATFRRAIALGIGQRWHKHIAGASPPKPCLCPDGHA